MIYRFTCLFLLVFYPVLGMGKFNPAGWYLKNINLEQGLSQCLVTDMALDAKGFLWVGTYDGLNRYDGSGLLMFKHQPGKKSSLPSSHILRLFADQDHHLWVLTASGMCIFDTRLGKTIQHDFLRGQTLTWLCANDNHSVWIYARGRGLFLVNTMDFSYKVFEAGKQQLNSNCTVLNLHKIGQSVFITGSCGDILRFDITAGTYSLYHPATFRSGVFDYSGTDKFGTIYLGSQQTDMVRFDPVSSTFSQAEFYQKDIKLISVRTMHYDPVNDVLLMGTYGQGLFIYDYASGKIHQFKKNDANPGLTSNYIQCVLSDKNGLLYLGYDGMGFDALDPFIRKFTTLRHDGKDDDKTLRFVRKILEDDEGRLLIGTSGSGLIRYDTHHGVLKFIDLGHSNLDADYFIIEMALVGHDLWIGYNGGGIDVLDLHTLRKKRSYSKGNDDRSLGDGVIWSLLPDGDDGVWVGTRSNGLEHVDIGRGVVTHFNRQQFPVLSTGIRCMAFTPKGKLLLGTEAGLFEFDTLRKQIRTVFPEKPDGESIASFKCIYTDRSGRFWLGTDGGGIYVLDRSYRLLNVFNSSKGLRSDVVYGILPENDSTFWFSSNAGLSVIHWSESSLKSSVATVDHYDEKNGLQSNEFNTGAYAKLRDGRMAFGGINGMNLFVPGEIAHNRILPDVYIHEFKVFHNDLLSDTLVSYLSNVQLKPFENSISLSFGTVGFSMPGRTRYQYRLVGHDKQWINAEGRNYVSYTNLKPGHYIFEVKACNYDGFWNTRPARLGIMIASPFYTTWWFIMIVVVIFFEVVYLVYRYRNKIRNEREEIKVRHAREIAEVEMKALRAQINPHFLFNSLNSINSYILRQDNKLASRYLVKFSQLVRNILNNSSSSYISLEEELNTIELYIMIEGMRFSNQFSYQIEVDPAVDARNILIPSLLLQPYVENAIWHGLMHKEGEKNITIHVEKFTPESICIQIDDNGVGREQAAVVERKPGHQKSFGMELSENRLKLMNEGNSVYSHVEVIDKYDKEHKSRGTTIRIVIPVLYLVDQKVSLN